MTLLESAIRNCGTYQITKDDVEKLLNWETTSSKQLEISFKPTRFILQDTVKNPMVLEYRVRHLGRFLYPDSVLGTHSHIAMNNGLGVVVIEAEAAMFGEVRSFRMVLPGVVGFRLDGRLKEGVSATHAVTQILRKQVVDGKFVEFFGEGMTEISVADRTTIASMAMKYGAIICFFPVDRVALAYLRLIGKSNETVAMTESYLRANKMFIDYTEPQQEQRAYTSLLQLDLGHIKR